MRSAQRANFIPEAEKYELEDITSTSLFWKSKRSIDASHCIKWSRMREPDCPPSLLNVAVPRVPRRLNRTPSKRRVTCGCGDDNCGDGIIDPLFVTVSKPKVAKKLRSSKRPQDKTAVITRRDGQVAHWDCFTKLVKEGKKTLKVSAHHMHPYALQQFRRLKDATAHPVVFKTFTLPRSQAAAAVTPQDIDTYFHYSEVQTAYIPKLNYPPCNHVRTPVSTPSVKTLTRALSPAAAPAADSPLSPEDMLDERTNNAANALESMFQECEFLNRSRTLAPEPQVARELSPPPPRYRSFFTETFHCGSSGTRQRHVRHRTVTHYFGLPNDFNDAVVFVQAFMYKHDLKERHSLDIRGVRLTPFEECLTCKWYAL